MTPHSTSSSTTDHRWLDQYPPGLPAGIEPDFTDMLSAFRHSVAEHPDHPAITYFDGVMTFAELDAQSDAFAADLAAREFGNGDRLAIYVQNDPAFVVALLGAWKTGGSTVAVNPMYRRREAEYLLQDSGATAIVCLDEGYTDVIADIIAENTTDLREIYIVSPRDNQRRNDPRVIDTDPVADRPGTRRFTDVVSTGAPQSATPPATDIIDEVALLMYTSGTTGRPKGAMITHRGLAFSSQVYRDWIGIGPDDRILGIAPLFHITGLVGHVTTSLLTGATLILNHRFQPDVTLDAIREHRPTFSVGSVTAFNALANEPTAEKADFTSLRKIFCGGAPIAPALAEDILTQTGFVLHNFYGMTETHSPAIGVPLGAEAPIDPTSGTLSIGVPVFDTRVRICDDERNELPAGEVGEILVTGPQVIDAYWNLPEASTERIIDGEIATGDVGFMDKDGWVYLVDRKNDMINAAGFKVWPREVEDVLYMHPAIREAAVVGVPDPYRIETVKAYISFKENQHATVDELTDHCREQLAAYKYPRIFEVLDRLPVSQTGKILRRELRERSREQ